MKNSISKYVVASLVVATFMLASLNAAIEINLSRDEAYTRVEAQTYSSSKAISMAYSGYKESELFESESLAVELETNLKALVKETGLMFAYIVVPDISEKTITYLFVEGDENVNSSVQNFKSERVKSRDKISDEMKRIASGESVRETLELNNEFGHVLSTYVPIYDSEKKVIAVAGTDKDITAVQNELTKLLPLRIAGLLFIGAISIIFVLAFMRKRVLKPVKEITRKMKDFGNSGTANFTKLNIETKDEFGLIASSFNDMADEIRAGVERIRAYAEEEARQKSELDAAGRIQIGMLEPSYYSVDDIEIRAEMKPAKEVGGDFYDYFTHENYTVVVIGDVSGKGLSGAILMASTLALIRAFVKSGLAPDEVLSAVNKELEHNNPNLMFVTVFLAYINRETNEMVYGNAGHNPPYLVFIDNATKIKDASSLPLGVLPETQYWKATTILPLGATLFLYTDGVNEAVNNAGEFFGNERLLTTLRDARSGDEVENLLAQLQTFTKGAEQSDDITMLSLKTQTELLTLPANRDNFCILRDWILRDERIEPEQRSKICLCCEELFVNIASYAYESDAEDVKIYKIFRKNSVIVQFVDKGKLFDPTKNINKIENYDPQSQVGGLGRFITNETADEWHYLNIEGKNVSLLVFKKSI